MCRPQSCPPPKVANRNLTSTDWKSVLQIGLPLTSLLFVDALGISAVVVFMAVTYLILIAISRGREPYELLCCLFLIFHPAAVFLVLS